MDKKILVISHGNCLDGRGAFLAALLKFGDEAEYSPQTFGGEIFDVEMCRDRDVYIFDYSFPLETILKIKSMCSKFALRDHHKSAYAKLNGVEGCYFDMNKSGAVLAWEYLHDTPVPELLTYIQDRDLWSNKLPHTEEINSFLYSNMDLSLTEWKTILLNFTERKNHYIEIGKNLLNYKNKLIQDILKFGKIVEFEGLNCAVSNSSVLYSDVANELMNLYNVNFACCYYHNSKEYVFSLRSRNGIDVSTIAGKFLGGGHAAASGFRLDYLPWERN